MEPVSIAFIAVGSVIVIVEIVRYVKKKFFHHKEDRHEDGVTIKADELTMDSEAFLKLTTNQDDTAEHTPSSASSVMHGTGVRIKIRSNHTSVEETIITQRERGGSEVARDLVHAMPSTSSTAVSIINAVSHAMQNHSASDSANASDSISPRHQSPKLQDHAQIKIHKNLHVRFEVGNADSMHKYSNSAIAIDDDLDMRTEHQRYNKSQEQREEQEIASDPGLEEQDASLDGENEEPSSNWI